MWWHLFVLSLSLQNCVSQITKTETPDDVVYQIIGLFETNAVTQRLAFDESVRAATMDGRKLEPTILQPNTSDSYSMWRELCKYKSFRPIAVFGPQNPISDGSVRDQCTIANIPHIQAAWQPFDPDFNFEEDETDEAIEELSKEEAAASEGKDDNSNKQPETPEFKKITINFYPDANEITTAFAKLLKFYNWEGFTILYEDDLGLLRIQKILAEHTYKHPVTVRRLDPYGDNHKVFKELKEFQESRIFLDCHVGRIIHYMNMAKSLEMVNHYQHYILSSLDTSILAEKLSVYTSNITWLSITEADKLKTLATRVGKWTLTDPDPPPDVSSFQLEALIIDDINKHLINAVIKLEKDLQQENPDVYITNKYNYVCDDTARWEYGARLQNEILKTNSTGVTGNIEFDEYGRRKNYVLYVNEIHLLNKDTIGRWMSANGDEIIDDRDETNKYGSGVAVNKNFIIISRKAKPYFFDKEMDKDCVGDDCGKSTNDKYEGFSVDLVDAIFKQLKKENFSYSYTFVHEKDKQYGKYDEVTKKWDGLIGDLLDKKADLAVCDLTITEERKKVVDFSVPFMTLGISILYTQEHKVPPGRFSFLNPYTIDVWLNTAIAYCGVSVVLFICSRISPADWENPQPCDKDPEELENIWNFKNCTWLTVGSIMCQGCDILPKAFGTRWVCALWWFFAVIVCQTYIAQLSASMTSALDNEPINDVEDLAKQNKILYGAYKGGSTLEFFRNSKDKMYQSMYMNMMANDAVLTSSNDEGERRVLKGNNKYAFFMESSTIEYKLMRNCSLKKVGGELDSKDYGIAMPANSPFRTHINRAILTLKESTELDKIKTKWWTKKYNATVCDKKSDDDDVEGDLEMENLIGAFLVLIMGLVFSVLITAAEFMNEVRNIVVREQVTHKEAFVEELKASLNFFQLQKPVLRNPSRAPSVASSDKSDTGDKQDRKAAMIENFLDFEKQIQ